MHQHLNDPNRPTLDNLDIPQAIIQKWGALTNIIADTFEVPTALITRFYADKIEIFTSNHSQSNENHIPPLFEKTYQKQTCCHCTSVITTNQTLIFNDKPNFPPNTISYMGLPIQWPNGELFGTLCLLDSHEKQYSQKLKTRLEQFALSITSDLKMIFQNHELTLSNDNLKAFAHTAAHDIKNPIANIATWADILSCKTDPQSKQHIMADHILHSTQKLNSLINDILVHAASSHLNQKLTPTNLNIVIDDITEDLQTLIHSTQAIINVTPLPTIHTNPTRIYQALLNIISNAIKYHRPETSPVISIQANTSPDKKHCQITITDNGIGFDPKLATSIFAPFKRLHKKNDTEGSGLGLATVLNIVHSLNGSIFASAKPNQGATFTIELPLEKSNTP